MTRSSTVTSRSKSFLGVCRRRRTPGRFEREAKLLASLNRANIASIFGFESGALVLEFVEGPTLAERIEQRPIPVEDAIAIAKQIAEALEAGHEAAVTHRDLKPAIIRLQRRRHDQGPRLWARESARSVFHGRARRARDSAEFHRRW